MADKNRVRFWRGTRASYNAIITKDYWTRYSVKEADGRWVEYFGTNIINIPAGQVYPVKDIVESVDETTVQPGDRYLTTGNGEYNIVSYSVDASNTLYGETMPLGSLSVRVASKGMKEYQIVNDVLRTYDDIDCGTYE